MVKLIILIALVCLGLISARGFDNRGRLGGYNRYDGSSEENGNILLSRLCANATWPPAYVAQVQALITALINNGTFRDWFQEHTQEVAYFEIR
ncbi:unnamed protein product [Rotaria sp. Silwood1]|nr:unnamed protein product [Rotaria sp. Silwood1]